MRKRIEEVLLFYYQSIEKNMITYMQKKERKKKEKNTKGQRHRGWWGR